MRAPILVLGLLIAQGAFADEAKPTRPPDMAARRLEGRELVSPDQPTIRLHVDDAFVALPVLAFPIKNSTWAERYMFVDAPHKTIERVVNVQFEHALAGSPFRFVYPSKPPMTWGDAVYRHGAFALDAAKEIEENPDTEVAQTKRFLEKRGYRVGNLWHVARLARVADPAGLSEIIVFYQESVAPSSFVAPRSSEDNDLPPQLARELFERLNAAVQPK